MTMIEDQSFFHPTLQWKIEKLLEKNIDLTVVLNQRLGTRRSNDALNSFAVFN